METRGMAGIDSFEMEREEAVRGKRVEEGTGNDLLERLEERRGNGMETGDMAGIDSFQMEREEAVCGNRVEKGTGNDSLESGGEVRKWNGDKGHGRDRLV